MLGAMSVVAVFQFASSGSLAAGPAPRSFLVIVVSPGNGRTVGGRRPVWP